LHKIEEDGKSWLRRPKLYKGIVEPYKKKKRLIFVEERCCLVDLPLTDCRIGSESR